jgi:hypothetical protein
MKKTIAKAVTAAILISGAALASQPAMAMGFKNCTGEQIRIKIYNNNDVSKLIAKRNKTLGVNGYYDFKLDSKLYQVRVYRSRTGKDTEVLLVGGKNGNYKYSVRKSGNRYSLSNVNDCRSAGGGGGTKPAPYIAVSEGWWNTSGKPIVIRNVTKNSFNMRTKGKQNKTTYTRIKDNTYRGADGKLFVMRGNGVADWNGVRIRHR